MKKFVLTAALTLLLSAPGMAAPGNAVYVDVNGLVCDFCARALERVFGKQEEVSDISVDLESKVVTVRFNEGQSLDDETVRTLITDSGYNVRAIRRDETEQ
jgi:Copper chaperone